MSFFELPEDFYVTGVAGAQAAAEASVTASISATGTGAGDIAIWNGSEYAAGTLLSGSGISFAITYYPTYGLQVGVTASTLRTAIQIGGKWKLDGTAAPTVNDDNTLGYGIASGWVDGTGGDIYMAVSVGTGAALWKKITP